MSEKRKREEERPPEKGMTPNEMKAFVLKKAEEAQKRAAEKIEQGMDVVVSPSKTTQFSDLPPSVRNTLAGWNDSYYGRTKRGGRRGRIKRKIKGKKTRKTRKTRRSRKMKK